MFLQLNSVTYLYTYINQYNKNISCYIKKKKFNSILWFISKDITT